MRFPLRRRRIQKNKVNQPFEANGAVKRNEPAEQHQHHSEQAKIVENSADADISVSDEKNKE